MGQDNPTPTKRRTIEKPNPSDPRPYDFWVSVWFNGERSTDLPTIRTHANLTAIKATGHISSCAVSKNNNLSSIYTDDKFWFKATFMYPPQVAESLLASPLIKTSQSVVVFTPFPCATGQISIKELVALQETRGTPLCPTNGFKAHPVVPGGRPFTWSLPTLIELNRSVAENKKRRVGIPMKHVLHKLIELEESINGQRETDI
jgi:hypothetical protein